MPKLISKPGHKIEHLKSWMFSKSTSNCTSSNGNLWINAKTKWCTSFRSDRIQLVVRGPRIATRLSYNRNLCSCAFWISHELLQIRVGQCQDRLHSQCDGFGLSLLDLFPSECSTLQVVTYCCFATVYSDGSPSYFLCIFFMQQIWEGKEVSSGSIWAWCFLIFKSPPFHYRFLFCSASLHFPFTHLVEFCFTLYTLMIDCTDKHIT